MFDFLKKRIGGFIEGIAKKAEPEQDAGKRQEKTMPIPQEDAGAAPAGIPDHGADHEKEEDEESLPRSAQEVAVSAPVDEARERKETRGHERAPEKASDRIRAEGVPGEEGASGRGTPPERKSPEGSGIQNSPEARGPAPEGEGFLASILKGEVRRPDAPPRVKGGKAAAGILDEGNAVSGPVPPERRGAGKPGMEVAEARIMPQETRERIRLSAVSKVKSIFSRQVEITESDVKDLLESLELELLESDVDMTVAEEIRQRLHGSLVGSKVERSMMHQEIESRIEDTLRSVMEVEGGFDIIDKVKESDGPLVVMFIGINGAGKTTTIAKVARMIQNEGGKVVFAAADTFRAAAIEQMSIHAERLGVRVIKRDYGSDPTSVAFDAVNHAKAHGIDAVLIDTAGRQDTNISLLNEIKKMDRVVKPDLKIYVGESIAGNAIIEQVSAFHREIGLDGVILTKLDCDAKGGTILSISRATGIPVLYVGIGQGYEELERFDARKMARRIVG